MLALAIPGVESLISKSTVSDNGCTSHSVKRLSRKEFAVARKLDTKADGFDKVYLDYIKGYDSVPTMLVEAFRAKGLVFAGTSARESKAGSVTSGVIRFSAPPKPRQPAVDVKALEDKIAKLEAILAQKEGTPTLPGIPAKK